MARRRKGKKVLILILLATGLFYVNFKKEIFSYLTNIFSAEKKDINNNAENKPKLTGMTEKELVKNVEETDIRKKEKKFFNIFQKKKKKNKIFFFFFPPPPFKKKFFLF